LRSDGALLRRRLADGGIAVLACGVDPFRPPVRTLHQPRYDAMETYFDHWGPAGRRMMAASASIQLNIDIGPSATADQRWVIAHRIGPALAAAFANSPARGYRAQRLATLAQLDPPRRGGGPGPPPPPPGPASPPPAPAPPCAAASFTRTGPTTSSGRA